MEVIIIKILLILWVIIVLPPLIITAIKWVIEFYKDLFK